MREGSALSPSSLPALDIRPASFLAGINFPRRPREVVRKGPRFITMSRGRSADKTALRSVWVDEDANARGGTAGNLHSPQHSQKAPSRNSAKGGGASRGLVVGSFHKKAGTKISEPKH